LDKKDVQKVVLVDEDKKNLKAKLKEVQAGEAAVREKYLQLVRQNEEAARKFENKLREERAATPAWLEVFKVVIPAITELLKEPAKMIVKRSGAMY